MTQVFCNIYSLDIFERRKKKTTIRLFFLCVTRSFLFIEEIIIIPKKKIMGGSSSKKKDVQEPQQGQPTGAPPQQTMVKELYVGSVPQDELDAIVHPHIQSDIHRSYDSVNKEFSNLALSFYFYNNCGSQLIAFRKCQQKHLSKSKPAVESPNEDGAQKEEKNTSVNDVVSPLTIFTMPRDRKKVEDEPIEECRGPLEAFIKCKKTFFQPKVSDTLQFFLQAKRQRVEQTVCTDNFLLQQVRPEVPPVEDDAVEPALQFPTKDAVEGGNMGKEENFEIPPPVMQHEAPPVPADEVPEVPEEFGVEAAPPPPPPKPLTKEEKMKAIETQMQELFDKRWLLCGARYAAGSALWRVAEGKFQDEAPAFEA